MTLIRGELPGLSEAIKYLDDAAEHRATIGEMKMGSPDPWKHRSKSMSCSTCMWYVEKKAENTQVAKEDDKVVGRWRRHAPTMSG